MGHPSDHRTHLSLVRPAGPPRRKPGVKPRVLTEKSTKPHRSGGTVAIPPPRWGLCCSSSDTRGFTQWRKAKPKPKARRPATEPTEATEMTHRGKIREFPSVLFVASVARFLSSAFFGLALRHWVSPRAFFGALLRGSLTCGLVAHRTSQASAASRSGQLRHRQIIEEHRLAGVRHAPG